MKKMLNAQKVVVTENTKQESEAQSNKLNKTENAPSKVNELFGSGTEDSSDDATSEDEVLDTSPKKKSRKISSSSEGSDGDILLKKKLALMGKEKADVGKVKKNINMGKKLYLLSHSQEDKELRQKNQRQERIKKRRKGKEEEDAGKPKLAKVVNYSSSSVPDENTEANEPDKESKTADIVVQGVGGDKDPKSEE